MIIKAYQTLEDKNNIKYIETNGPFKCERSDAWLGHGYYFWDTNIKWAEQWGKNSYQRRGKNYIITQCELNIDEKCFDLVSSVACRLMFEEVIELFNSHHTTKKLSKRNVPNIISFMKKIGIFDYTSIRSEDIPRPKKVYYKYNREYMLLGQRVQVCVIDLKTVFIPPLKVIYPNKM